MKRRLWLVLVFAWFCSACGSPAGSTQTSYPPPQESTALLSPGTAYPAPQVTTALPEPGATLEESQSTSYPPPEDTAPPPTDNGSPYPPPGETQIPTPTSPTGTGSPGPTQYPGPQDTFTPAPTQELIPTLTPGFSITATLTVTPGMTPTERPISTAMPPPGTIAQTIRIWHSWSQSEMRVLEYVIRKFQDFYPGVAFELLYVPYDELFQRYEMAVYRGGGPSVLFGPAEWGPLLYEKGLVADLTRDADPKFLAELQPVALGGARYRGALVGLPHRIRGGVLLYRNTSLLPQPATSFEELVSMSRQATRGGRLGAYLDRGFLYSAAHLVGLGGSLIDDQGKPAFNTPQGVEWLKLLAEFERAGGVDFNTNRDLNAFKDGKVGLLIEGSWKLTELAQAIGKENLAIDLWPKAGGGQLAGFVQVDNVYLNANLSGDPRYAALLFMGYLLARQVQGVLVQAGHVPAVRDVLVEDLAEDPFMLQALRAYELGVPYPVDPALQAYLDPLETAMRAAFDGLLTPQAALQRAYDEIMAKLE